MKCLHSMWQWLVDYRKPLLIAVGAWLLMQVDPLGFEEATAGRATRTVMRMSSLLYDGSNHVTVVLYDQAYLDAHPGRTWPLRYSEQGLLLKRLDQYGPSGIFIDLLYKNPHTAGGNAGRPHVTATTAFADDNPLDLLKPIAATRTPIYVSGLPLDFPKWDCESRQPVHLDRGSIVDAIHGDKLVTIVPSNGSSHERVGMVSWSGCEERYPLMLGQSPYAMTPAFMLYRDACLRNQKWRFDAPCHKLIAGDAAPMTIRWGAHPPKSQYAYYNGGVCQGTSEPTLASKRIVGMVRQFFFGIIGPPPVTGEPNDALPCPAFNVIPAALLTEGGRRRADLEASIRGHAVFVGADIPGVPDTVVSPVHGQVPGVFFHAMALDNLFTEEDGYLRDLPPAFWLCAQLATLIIVAVFAASRLPSLDRVLKPVLVHACVLTWIICGWLAFTQEDYVKALVMVVCGLGATWLVRAEAGRVMGLFAIICLTAVGCVELGVTPTNWIVLAIAAALTNQAVRHGLEHDEAVEPAESSAPLVRLTATAYQLRLNVVRILNPLRRKAS